MIALADCGVAVLNAKESARWWEEKVGFVVHTIPGSGHAVMVAPPGDRFVLHLCEGFEKVDPGNTGIAFVTDEIEEMVARMERGGVKFSEPLRKESWGGMAKFLDPDGNIFWLLGAPTSMIKGTATRARAAPRKPSRRPRKRSGASA